MSFLGFLIFLTIAGAGFWLLIFLMGILPYWIFGGIKGVFRDFLKK